MTEGAVRPIRNVTLWLGNVNALRQVKSSKIRQTCSFVPGLRGYRQPWRGPRQLQVCHRLDQEWQEILPLCLLLMSLGLQTQDMVSSVRYNRLQTLPRFDGWRICFASLRWWKSEKVVPIRAEPVSTYQGGIRRALPKHPEDHLRLQYSAWVSTSCL